MVQAPKVKKKNEYWSELPFPSPGDLPNPGIEPESLALAGCLSLSHWGSLAFKQFNLKPPGGEAYLAPPTPVSMGFERSVDRREGKAVTR